MSVENLLPCPISLVADLKTTDYDGLLLVFDPKDTPKISILEDALKAAKQLDSGWETEIGLHPIDLPVGKLILAPTGPLNPDYDDVRSFAEAAEKGVKRALKAGVKNLLVALEQHLTFPLVETVALLGVCHGLDVALQTRENFPSKVDKLEKLGVYVTDSAKGEKIVRLVRALEAGLRIARDIGGADPERMTPKKAQQYVEEIFRNTNISINVIDDEATFAKEYPLFEAVNRAASVVERHQGRIIFLEYNPPANSKVVKTLFLVGKGVTYDTGGMDLKVKGAMAGMSKDKCGAASVAGFMWLVNHLKPDNLKVVAAMPMVRNSIGSNGYVADELIRARSGQVIRVGNTDAEGRMIMADVLCKVKELALNAINPELFTIATLTGHAALAVGPYTIALDNGPARREQNAQRIQQGGDLIGDPVEISRIRREDFASHKGQGEGEDVTQCSNQPSSKSIRGHQGPAAFLMLSSGLHKHGSADEKPLKYTHLDIAGTQKNPPANANGAPVLALAQTYLLADYF